MYVHVAFFSILLAGEKTLSKAKGSAGKDGMAYHNGMQFSTYDQDNDKSSISCAYALQGGWWYENCFHLNLNGPHNTPSWAGVDKGGAKLYWYDGPAGGVLSSVEMKIRAKTCHE